MPLCISFPVLVLTLNAPLTPELTGVGAASLGTTNVVGAVEPPVAVLLVVPVDVPPTFPDDDEVPVPFAPPLAVEVVEVVELVELEV